MFIDAPSGYGGMTNGGGKPLPPMTTTARRVHELLKSAPQNNEGLHVHHIAAQLGLPANDVFKAGDELLSLGQIYTTVDDETWAVLEY
jgi:replication factor A2